MKPHLLITPEEKELVERWLSKRKRRGLADTPIDPGRLPSIREDMYKRILEKISRGEKKKYGLPRRKWLGMAAAVLLFIATGLAVYYGSRKWNVNDDSVISNRSGSPEQTVLPDGSVAWLNQGSSIRLAKEFQGNERTVFIEDGEVFFDVKRNENKPFVANVSGLSVRVLGTSFNVKAFDRMEDIRVTVATGAIQVTKGSEALETLGKNQELIYRKQISDYTIREVESLKVASWRNGDIYLENVPFSEFVMEAEQRYQVKIRYPQEKLNKERISICMKKDQPLQSVLRAIRRIYNIEYQINGKEVMIR